MSLKELITEFVKETNKIIQNQRNGEVVISETDLRILKDRISKTMKLFQRAESNVFKAFEKIKKSDKNDLNVQYIRQGGKIKAILSKDLVKPEICDVDKIEGKCYCLSELQIEFPALKDIVLIDSIKSLNAFDRTIKTVILEVFDHDYRSYNGFTCFLSVFSDGILYIIDAIKFRKEIPKLRLLNCGVHKIIHCRKCVERLFKDFGEIGCYQNFNVDEEDVFIDFRIRPINSVFLQVIKESFLKTLQKNNLGISKEKYEIFPENPVSDFVDKYRINSPALGPLLEFRDFLACENDEGLEYTLPDEHIILLLEGEPETVQEFTNLIPRMSPLTRIHATDILIILSHKGLSFTMDKLKTKKDIQIPQSNVIQKKRIRDFESRDPQQRFVKPVEVIDETSSDLVISED